MWLLPVIFMLHDFEEIIMIKPWFSKNKADFLNRFPAIASRVMKQYESESTSSFALAVAEEFLLLSLLTWLAVEGALYALWTGLLIAFLLHLAVHVLQFMAYRKYVPVIITSLLGIPYGLFALYDLNSLHLLSGPDVAFWTIIAFAIMVINLLFIHRLAARFETWLNMSFGKS